MKTINPEVAKKLSDKYQHLTSERFELNGIVYRVNRIQPIPNGITRLETAIARNIITPEFIEGDNWKVVGFTSPDEGIGKEVVIDLDELCGLLNKPFEPDTI